MWDISSSGRALSLSIIDFESVDEDSSSTTQALMDTLKSEEKFESFIQWMYREFSFEAGLCFIELIQFKKSLIKFIKKKSKSKTQSFDTRYIDVLYDAVPKSSIVFAKGSKLQGIAKYKQMAHALVDKYIRPEAEFEINISYAMRMEYTQMAETDWQMEPIELVDVFEKITFEMVSFMKQSFTRFQANARNSVTTPSTS